MGGLDTCRISTCLQVPLRCIQLILLQVGYNSRTCCWRNPRWPLIIPQVLKFSQPCKILQSHSDCPWEPPRFSTTVSTSSDKVTSCKSLGFGLQKLQWLPPRRWQANHPSLAIAQLTSHITQAHLALSANFPRKTSNTQSRTADNPPLWWILIQI